MQPRLPAPKVGLDNQAEALVARSGGRVGEGEAQVRLRRSVARGIRPVRRSGPTRHPLLTWLRAHQRSAEKREQTASASRRPAYQTGNAAVRGAAKMCHPKKGTFSHFSANSLQRTTISMGALAIGESFEQDVAWMLAFQAGDRASFRPDRGRIPPPRDQPRLSPGARYLDRRGTVPGSVPAGLPHARLPAHRQIPLLALSHRHQPGAQLAARPPSRGLPSAPGPSARAIQAARTASPYAQYGRVPAARCAPGGSARRHTGTPARIIGQPS